MQKTTIECHLQCWCLRNSQGPIGNIVLTRECFYDDFKTMWSLHFENGLAILLLKPVFNVEGLNHQGKSAGIMNRKVSNVSNANICHHGKTEAIVPSFQSYVTASRKRCIENLKWIFKCKDRHRSLRRTPEILNCGVDNTMKR